MWLIIQAIINYTWLFLTLLLLWLIWRNSVRTQKAQQVLNAIAMKNAEAAQKAAEAAHILAKQLEKPAT
jgi:hypothetical protein